MKNRFPGLAAICLLALSLVMTACSSATPAATQATGSPVPSVSPTPSPSPTPVNTAFSQMLKFMPYSFLQQHDVWFGDQARVKQIYGFADINNLDAYNKLPADESKKLGLALEGIAGLQTNGNWQQIPPLLTGFDIWMVDQTLLDESIPVRPLHIMTGKFDGDLIASDLQALGYQRADYSSYSYLSINEDYSPGNPLSPISTQVLSAMNRVSIVDNTLIAVPATKEMTDILDTIDKKQTAVIDDPACRALAVSLGDVVSGVIITPERAMNQGFINLDNAPLFNFTLPQDWGLLHPYDMLGMGYKDDGHSRTWSVSLYYKDASSAAADADILANRMKNYVFNTQFEPTTTSQNTKWTPLTDRYEVGQAVVKQNEQGATLTVECRFKPETRAYLWRIPVIMPMGFRDLLFLVPDPAPYLAK